MNDVGNADDQHGSPVDRLLTFTGTVAGVAGDYVCVDDVLATAGVELPKLNAVLVTMNVNPVVNGGVILADDARWASTIINVTRRHAGEHRPLCVIDRELLGVQQ